MQSIGRIQYRVSRGHGYGRRGFRSRIPGFQGAVATHLTTGSVRTIVRLRFVPRGGRCDTSKGALLVGWNVEIRY